MTARKTILSGVLLIAFGLIFSSCGGGGGGDDSLPQTSDSPPQTSDSPTANSYEVYGGTIINYEVRPLVWSERTLIGSASGTAEFDIAAAGLSSISDIEIVANSEIYIDAVQNLQNNSTIGYNGDGTYAGFYIDSTFCDNPMNAVGLPDGKTSRLQRGGHFITRLSGSHAGGEKIIDDGSGNDIKIFIGLN